MHERETRARLEEIRRSERRVPSRDPAGLEPSRSAVIPVDDLGGSDAQRTAMSDAVLRVHEAIGGAGRGAPVQQASHAIGASAYAMGESVAFRGAPDLHTAAHEAAHVVQQRAGISLSGGVWQVGDRYERHADQVADAVVRGADASGLLDQMAGGSSSSAGAGAVQRTEQEVETTPTTDAELERRALATAHTIRDQVAVFTAELQAATRSLSSPPTFAEMQQLDGLLRAFEDDIERWRGLVMRADERSREPQTAQQWSGADPLDSALGDLRDVFQAAVRAFQGGVDQRNDTEIRREAALVEKPAAERLRTDAGTEPLGDRDWLPLYVPGMRIKRNALPTSKPTKGEARAPEQIKSAVIHTGGPTNQGTLNRLTSKSLAGHFSVDGSGATEQMNPVSQMGIHAGVANRTSIAIDLAYGHRTPTDEYGEVAFLDSAKQMVNAARILVAQDRISPEVVGTSNTRGAILGRNVDAAESMVGGFGGVMEVASGKGMEDDISGVVQHKDLPDSDHGDPGDAYIQRLQALVPVLEAYERRYGPIDIEDARELERVVGVIERYEETTGRAAAGIPLREFRLRSEAEIAAAEKKAKRALEDTEMQAIYSKVYSELEAEAVSKTPKKEKRDRIKSVREELDREIPDADIAFRGSVPERRVIEEYLKEVIDVPEGVKDKPAYRWKQKTAAQVDEARATSAYKESEAAYPNATKNMLAATIVRGQDFAKVMDENLKAFRVYLATHLPELVR